MMPYHRFFAPATVGSFSMAAAGMPQKTCFQKGFSLIEMMVALVVGSLAVLVVLQVFIKTGEGNRTAAGGGQAQSSGAVALTQLGRDIRGAGYGFMTNSLLGCSLVDSSISLVPVGINTLDAVTGSPATAGATDILVVAYGMSDAPPAGDEIVSVSSNQKVFSLAALGAFQVGDRVVITPEARVTNCELVLDTVTSVVVDTSGAAPVTKVTVATGSSNVGKIYNLGDFQVRAFRVGGNNLLGCNLISTDCSDGENWELFADNVVSLRAQYGRSSNSGVVWSQSTPTTVCEWKGVTALRLVLVVRNGDWNKGPVTIDMPTWSASSDGVTNPEAVPITLSGSWQNYRYIALETAVPLHNIIGMEATGC